MVRFSKLSRGAGRGEAGSALCSQDVATLQYRAPNLAVKCLTQALEVPPSQALILDVACGTGLVGAEVRLPLTASALPQGQVPSGLLACVGAD